MFFKKLKKAKSLEIFSPLNGELIPIENVPDPVFSEKMMGDGFGFEPENGTIVSPVTGKVTQVFPTKHAIGFLAEGVEILLHLGLETVGLNGEGFDIHVAEGQKVKAGETIGNFDLDFIKEKGKKTTTALVFTNGQETVNEITSVSGTNRKVQAGDKVATVSLK